MNRGVDTEVTGESLVIPPPSLRPGALGAAESREGGPETEIVVSQYIVSISAPNTRPGPLWNLESSDPQMDEGWLRYEEMSSLAKYLLIKHEDFYLQDLAKSQAW